MNEIRLGEMLAKGADVDATGYWFEQKYPEHRTWLAENVSRPWVLLARMRFSVSVGPEKDHLYNSYEMSIRFENDAEAVHYKLRWF